MYVLRLFILPLLINVAFFSTIYSRDINEVIDPSVSSCPCFRSTVEKPTLLENGHGTIVAYFKYAHGDGYEAAKVCSGFMDSSGAIITSAHGVTCITHGLTDVKKLNDSNTSFLSQFEPYCFKAHFFSRKGERYDLENPYILPSYFKQDSTYLNGDLALLLCSLPDDELICNVKFHISSDMREYTPPQQVIGQLSSYVYHTGLNSSVLKRESRDLTGDCIISEYCTEIHMDTVPGMSGANIYYIENKIQYLFAVHRGTTSDSRHNGVTLNYNNQQNLRCGHHNLIKEKIWSTLTFYSSAKNTVTTADNWRPVLFSIQTDEDEFLQSDFLIILKQKLSTKLSIKDILYSEKVQDIFDFFSFSGNGRRIFCDIFPGVTHDNNSLPYIENTPELNASLFNAPSSTDVTNRGTQWARMHNPEMPMFICSLGISKDTEIEHKVATKYVDNEYVYKRINYLHLKTEKINEYRDKIKNEADWLSDQLILNYFKKEAAHPGFNDSKEKLTVSSETVGDS